MAIVRHEERRTDEEFQVRSTKLFLASERTKVAASHRTYSTAYDTHASNHNLGKPMGVPNVPTEHKGLSRGTGASSSVSLRLVVGAGI